MNKIKAYKLRIKAFLANLIFKISDIICHDIKIKACDNSKDINASTEDVNMKLVVLTYKYSPFFFFLLSNA